MTRKATILLLFSFLLFGITRIEAAETASQILDRAATKVRQQKSIVASYTISADGHNQDGTLTLAGDRFTLSSPGLASWYDGKTQWTYSDQIGEVNVTEPTPEELQQVNPFAIVNSFKKIYAATLLKSPVNEKKIALKANSKHSDIRNVVLTLDSSTLYPKQIVLTMSNRRTVTIKLNSIRPGGNLPLSFFRFDSKKYPGIQVIDLR